MSRIGQCPGGYSGAVGTGAFVWPANSHTLSGYDYTAIHHGLDIRAHLHDLVATRLAEAPGNSSAFVLRRPSAGGVELMTVSVWESASAVPGAVVEDHRLLVARQTVPAHWELVEAEDAVASAA